MPWSSYTRRMAAAPRAASLAFAVLLLGLLLTLAAVAWLRADAQQRAEVEFERLADRVEREALRRLGNPVFGLNGARGVFAASREVNLAEFRAYVESRQMATEFPGVRGFAYVERIERAALPAFEAAVRAEGAPAFRVRGSGNAADLYPIKYIEPLANNLAAWGFDLGSEVRRRAAIEQAIASGETTLTLPIVLLQDEQPSPGFLLFQPIYRVGADPVTPLQREQALRGLVYAPLIARELFADLPRLADGLLDLEVAVGNSRQLERVFPAAGAAPAAERGALKAQRRLGFGGRDLQLSLHSLPAFDARMEARAPMLAGLGGMALSAALALAIWLLASARQRAQALADAMTADLSRLAHVARGTTNCVIATDAELRISWVNEGFTRVTGYTPQEALGQTVGTLLGSGLADPAALATLAAAAEAGQGCRVEIQNRRKDGSLYWVETEVQPVHDQGGRLSGFIEIALDITERKAAEQELRRRSELMASAERLAGVGAWELDTVSGAVHWSGQLLSLLDVPPGQDFEFDDLLALFAPLARHQLEQAIERATGAGTPWDLELGAQTPLGRFVWLRIIGAPASGGPGDRRLVGALSDVTGRRELEARTERSNAVLRSVLDNLPCGLSVFDGHLQLVADNEAFRRLLGFPDELFAGHGTRFEDIIRFNARRGEYGDPAVAEQQVSQIVERARHPQAHLFERLRPDGTVLEVRGAPMPGGGFVTTYVDVTERKRAAELLHLERERLANIIDGTDAGTWEWNALTGEVRFSERWAAMLGYTLAELQPLTVATWDSLAHPEDLKAAKLKLLAHLRGEQPQYEAELRARHKSGRWIWIHSRGKVMSHDASGQPLWMGGIHLDITERRLAAEAQERSNALLRSVIDNLPCGLSVFDAERRLLACNAEFLRLLDLPPDWVQPRMVDFEQVLRYNAARGEYGEGDPEAQVQERLAMAWGGASHQFERSRPGGLVLEGRGSRMPDGGLVTTYVDISSRKRMEAQQQRSSALLQAMLENLPCGLTVFDGQHRLVLHNRRFAELYDLDDAFFADTPVTVDKVALLMNERREYGELSVEQAVRAARVRADDAMLAPHFWERERPNGLLLEMRSAPLPDGGFVTTYTDVGEQRRAAAELARSNALLNAVLDASTKVAIIATGLDHNILVFNRGAEHMLGYSAAEVIGRMQNEPLHDPQDLARFAQQVSRQLGQSLDWRSALLHPSQLGREIEAVYVRKDGSRFPALRVVTEMRARDGSLQGWLGVAFDISRQKESEASLREAKAVAEQASQAKSQFLANMSHEIRTPMNAILGMLKLLRRTPLDPRQQDYAGKTEGAARSLLALLNDILDFSKVEAGKLQLESRPFSLPALLEELEVLLRATLGDKPLQLRLVCDERLPVWLSGDALRLRQVLTNLGGNAIKFTPAGSVQLSLRLLGESERGLRLGFEVSDTGIGIAPEHQQQIFAGFTQAEASTTRRFGGTGLGLAISQRLVELMGGQLELHSAPGQGSRFFFTLELARTEAPGPDGAALAAAGDGPRLQGLRLLVVEDNPNNQQVARELLEDEGAEVQLADNGLLALQRLAAAQQAGEGFDAVLMDVQMPVMDGYAATRELRSRPGFAQLPVVAMTANALPSDREAALAAGMNEHIGKPFDLDELVALLRRLVGRQALDDRPYRGDAAGAALDTGRPGLPRMDGLDLEAALRRMMGKAALLLRMVRGFAHSAAELPAQLRQAAAAGDAAATRAALHGFKGLAATVGASRLAQLAGQGEALSDQGLSADWIDALQRQIDDDCQRLEAAAVQLLGASDGPAAAEPTPPTDPDPVLRQQLTLLSGLLANSDLAALDAMEQLRRLRGSLGAQALEALDEAMAQLDFAAALQQCRVLEQQLAQTGSKQA